jgi:hypothetical protein
MYRFGSISSMNAYIDCIFSVYDYTYPICMVIVVTDISFYPKGLATFRPTDGADVAIITSKSEHRRHKFCLILSYFTPILSYFVLFCNLSLK